MLILLFQLKDENTIHNVVLIVLFLLQKTVPLARDNTMATMDTKWGLIESHLGRVR